MFRIISTLFLGITLSLSFAQSQTSNIFLGRDFWKKDPSVKTVQLLIAEGNNPTEMNRFAFDALCYAILENTDIDVLKYLLSLEGNEVNKITHDGRNYLMWAAYKGNVALTEYLIEEVSDTKIVDEHGYNLMTFAAISEQKDLAIFDLILANGGSIDDKTREGATALLLNASHMKNEATLNYFINKGADINATDHEGNNLFIYAARLGNIFTMEKAIEKGINPKKINNTNGNAITFAAIGWRRTTNPLSTFAYLKSKGVEANIVTKDGNTPLHYLARNQTDTNVIHFFLKNGVDPNLQNKEGSTALFQAIRGDNEAITQKLLTLTKDINHQNEAKKSALMYAYRELDVDLAKQLIEKGADTKVKDAENRNLIVHLFRMLNTNSKEDFEVLLKLAQENGVNETTPFEKGKNLLHLAIEEESAYLIEQAIALNQDVNHKNKEGLTPLHVAAMKSKNDTLLKLLLKHGADKSIRTDFEESAYDLADQNELLKVNKTNLKFLMIN